jgi:SAM-dependent methyltransferase
VPATPPAKPKKSKNKFKQPQHEQPPPQQQRQQPEQQQQQQQVQHPQQQVKVQQVKAKAKARAQQEEQQQRQQQQQQDSAPVKPAARSKEPQGPPDGDGGQQRPKNKRQQDKAGRSEPAGGPTHKQQPLDPEAQPRQQAQAPASAKRQSAGEQGEQGHGRKQQHMRDVADERPQKKRKQQQQQQQQQLLQQQQQQQREQREQVEAAIAEKPQQKLKQGQQHPASQQQQPRKEKQGKHSQTPAQQQQQQQQQREQQQPSKRPQPAAARPSKLLDKMRARLEGGRFRQLNEALYTRSGGDAFGMMAGRPELFQAYHDGFQQQVTGWPLLPVDAAIAWARGLPAGAVVADFGCGDAKLAASVKQARAGPGANRSGGRGLGRRGGGAGRRGFPPCRAVACRHENSIGRLLAAARAGPLQPQGAGLGSSHARASPPPPPTKTQPPQRSQKVHSLDLVASAPGVIACNMARTPLAAGSCDAAVFSLSLMGTDYGDFLSEAHRVLRPGGWLWIAEVRSRFPRGDGGGGEDFGPFVGALRRLGFKLIKQDATNRMFVTMLLRKRADGGEGGEGGGGRADAGKIEWPPLRACVYKKR